MHGQFPSLLTDCRIEFDFERITPLSEEIISFLNPFPRRDRIETRIVDITRALNIIKYNEAFIVRPNEFINRPTSFRRGVSLINREMKIVATLPDDDVIPRSKIEIAQASRSYRYFQHDLIQLIPIFTSITILLHLEFETDACIGYLGRFYRYLAPRNVFYLV